MEEKCSFYFNNEHGWVYPWEEIFNGILLIAHSGKSWIRKSVRWMNSENDKNKGGNKNNKLIMTRKKKPFADFFVILSIHIRTLKTAIQI